MKKVGIKIAVGLICGLALNSLAIEKKKFDFVVGIDGDFKAAMAAASAAKPSEQNRFVIFFPNGEYDLTKLTADRHGKTTFSTSFVSLIGETRDKVVIANKTDTESIGHTATLYFSNNTGMYLQDLTVQNKSTFCGNSACRQVAIQQTGDKFIYKNVKLVSGQDTYYTTKRGRTYWDGGEIQGSVDFICGGGDVFFEGTNLVVTRNVGYITASQNPGNWGYVFNNAKINVSNGSFNGTFYLGRSWSRAKVVYLNTTMYAWPTAEGWGKDMNTAPAVYGEYNSKNGNGGNIDVSRRKTFFDGGKDGSTATSLKTVWNASDAANYTLANVVGGTDKWEPNKLTAQVAAPKISQDGAEIIWADDENARCWAVFVNGKFKTSVATNSIDIDGIAPGSKVTVRAANSMGGLGASSNEIAVVESNVTYYKVIIQDVIGGKIENNLNSNRIAEDKVATFTAQPAEGWKFEGWTGKSAETLADASTPTLKITATGDIQVGAIFSAKGIDTFQAESGIIENAINESTNAGYEGSGYINFGAGNSFVKIPVYVEAPGIYTMAMRYANGSTADRDLIIAPLGFSDDKDRSEQITFEKTGAWTTFETKETKIELPLGASYIQFSVVGNNDGPNLDQITLTPFDVAPIEPVEPPEDSIAENPNFIQDLNFSNHFSKANFQLFNARGKLVCELKNSTLSNFYKVRSSMPAGVYILKVVAPNFKKQAIIRKN